MNVYVYALNAIRFEREKGGKKTENVCYSLGEDEWKIKKFYNNIFINIYRSTRRVFVDDFFRVVVSIGCPRVLWRSKENLSAHEVRTRNGARTSGTAA